MNSNGKKDSMYGKLKMIKELNYYMKFMMTELKLWNKKVIINKIDLNIKIFFIKIKRLNFKYYQIKFQWAL